MKKQKEYIQIKYEIAEIRNELADIDRRSKHLVYKEVLLIRELKNHPDHPVCNHSFDNTYKCKKCGERK